MQNFEFEHNGKKLWYSRSLAVSALVHFIKDGEFYILANKRGSGAEFNQHLWNLPGGFVDFNETAEQAACRSKGMLCSLRQTVCRMKRISKIYLLIPYYQCFIIV